VTRPRTAARNAASISRKSQSVTVHSRKMYVDCRFGQLHLHTAFPSSGGFDELTPLVCIAPAPLSGRLFKPLLGNLGKDRSVYAPDLPGCGESDSPSATPTMSDYSAGLVDLLDSLRLRQVDVLGYKGGSLAAVEFALARPTQVRRVILVGVPMLDAKEREAESSSPSESGQRLAPALRGYPAGERLPLMHQPTLVLRQKDEFWQETARTDALLREGRRVDLPEDFQTLDDGAAELVTYVREFLDS